MTTSNYVSSMAFPDVFRNKMLLGYDKIIQDLLNTPIPQISSNYPPHNYKRVGENLYVLEMAVAGFAPENLDVTVEDNKLTISGEIPEKDEKDETIFIHRGIAGRAFSKTFTVADTIVVQGSSLENGILSIFLENVIPEYMKPRKVAIEHSKPKFLEQKEEKELLME